MGDKDRCGFRWVNNNVGFKNEITHVIHELICSVWVDENRDKISIILVNMVNEKSGLRAKNDRSARFRQVRVKNGDSVVTIMTCGVKIVQGRYKIRIK